MSGMRYEQALSRPKRMKEPKFMNLKEAAEGGVIAEHGMEPPHHFGAGEHKALAAHIEEHFGMNQGESEGEGDGEG
jgi:hypothetical protein